MKKFRFLVVLLGLFALLGFSKTIKAAENYTVTISYDIDGTVTQHGDPVTVPADTQYIIDEHPTSIDGKVFKYWVIDGFVRTDYGKNLTITVRRDMSVVAVYASDTKAVVTFMDSNTKCLDREFVNKNGYLPPSYTLPNPKKPRSDLQGWVTMAGYETDTPIKNFSSVQITNDVIYVAKYKVPMTAPSVEITVNGNPVDTYTGDELEYTLPAGDVAWKDVTTNKILSYNQTYKFTVFGQPRNIVSVSDVPAETSHVAIYYEKNLSMLREHSYVGHFEGFESVVEFGFVYTKNGVDVYKNLHNYNPSTNEFLMSTNDLYANVRAYVIYTVGGVEYTVVSEPVESSYKTFTVKLGTLPYSTGNDKVMLIGDMTGWNQAESLEFKEVGGVLQVAFEIDYDKAGGHDFKLYLDRGDGATWTTYEAADNLTQVWENYNLTNAYLQTNTEVTVSVTNWKSLVAVRLTSVPNISMTDPYTIRLIGDFNSWNRDTTIEFETVNGVLQAVFVHPGTSGQQFHVYLETNKPSQVNWWDHQIADIYDNAWGNQVINDLSIFNGQDKYDIDVPKWKGIPNQ